MNSKKFSVGELFTPKTGDFHAYNELEPGETPVISCGKADNGVAGYYDVPEDKQYSHAITIAYNGWYTFNSKFHPYSFGAKDDVAVLIPKSSFNDKTLLYIAAAFNQMQWRYSYSRKCFKNKLISVEIELPTTDSGGVDEDKIAEILQPLGASLPQRSEAGSHADQLEDPADWIESELSNYFELQQGDFNALPTEEGDVPTVSRKSENNGIVGYYEPPEGAEIYSPTKITVSTVSGKAFVQTQPFIDSDKVVILTPKGDRSISEMYFFQLAIDNEQWRFSYGRSCFASKLQNLKIRLPVASSGDVDRDYMRQVMESAEYWEYLETKADLRTDTAPA